MQVPSKIDERTKKILRSECIHKSCRKKTVPPGCIKSFRFTTLFGMYVSVNKVSTFVLYVYTKYIIIHRVMYFDESV